MKGAYILLLEMETDAEIAVGGLGPILFRRGLYAYIGSARGGLEARVARHFRKDKRVRWHIDYLTLAASAIHVILIPAKDSPECFLGRRLQELGYEMVKGFGAGDCSCPSHLAYLGETSIPRSHNGNTWCSSPQRREGLRTPDTRG